MKITIYPWVRLDPKRRPVYRKKWIPRLRVFERGFKAHGDEVVWLGRGQRDEFGDVSLRWNLNDPGICTRFGARRMIVELGFIGPRKHNWFVGFDGLNGHATTPAAIEGRRHAMHKGVEVLPWREAPGGRPLRALVLSQVPQDRTLAGLDGYYGEWLGSLSRWLEDERGCEVRHRAHPKAGRAYAQMARFPAPPGAATLKDALAWADFAVGYSSNSLVDAVLAGVPAVPLSTMSMAWGVRSTLSPQVELRYPDRDPWLDWVMSAQWSLREIASGLMWEHYRGMV